jgi:hypothetical protein
MSLEFWRCGAIIFNLLILRKLSAFEQPENFEYDFYLLGKDFKYEKEKV